MNLKKSTKKKKKKFTDKKNGTEIINIIISYINI